MIFINSQNLGKIGQKMPVFWPKTIIFADFGVFFGKNYRFWTKSGHFLADLGKILGIDKNHLNTSYVKIVGHLGHFWQNMTIFGHFWLTLA